MNKLRILLNSNAPWATSGYSQQVADLAPLIRDELSPLALGLSNFFGQSGGSFILDGIMMYPVINHVYGSDALVQHGKHHNADVSFALQDVWVLNPEDLIQVKRFIPIVPIDHDPVSQPVLNNLRFAYKIITYSKFGQKELQRNGLFSTYIPHAVNTEIFKPMDKAERKAHAGLPPDCYLVGMVAANKDNPPRKSFQEVMDAFVMFLKDEPKALLYIHTNPEFPGGFNIKQYADFLKISDKLLFPDNYEMNFNTSKQTMNLLYNTFDVLLMPSISEGFGIPAIEAQACGVPVIVNNFTSMPELVVEGVTGEITKLASKRFSPQGSYMGIPDTKSIYECMLKIYKGDRKSYSEKAREFMVKTYDTKRVFTTKWKPYLDQLEREIYPVDNSPKSTA